MKTIRSVFICFGVFAAATACRSGHDGYDALYRNLPFEMARVERPAIPATEVNITDFGGTGDGIGKNTAAFGKAFESLAERGGGRLIVPEGVWYTGPIELRENTELHLDRNAIIVFSEDMDDYPLVRTIFEGLDTYRCVSPISATGVKNVAITGHGTIDGSGHAWRFVKKEKMTAGQWERLVKSGGVLNEQGNIWFPSESSRKGFEISDMNVPRGLTEEAQWLEVKDFLRPVMVSLRECERILLEGVTFQNSPSWNIHPLICRDLIVDNVTVRNPWYAQNGDGLDIESCANVLVVNSSFDVGDDAVCIKSGKNEDGRRRGIPTSNVIVDNCTVFHGHGGFVVGSEMSGGVNNIQVSNCRFLGTDIGLRFKSQRGRGGVVENIYIQNISMIGIPAEALLFDLFYDGTGPMEDDPDWGRAAPEPQLPVADETTPVFRNIVIRDVQCRGAGRAMLFNGLPEMNVENVSVENTSIYAARGAEINNSNGVELRNVKIYSQHGPALTLRDVKNLRAENFGTRVDNPEALRVTGRNNDNISIRSDVIGRNNSTLAPGTENAVFFE